MILSSSIPLLIFYLIFLSVAESRALKSPAIIVDFLFLLSTLSVFASCILKLCCLMNTHLASLCLLHGLILLSFHIFPVLPGKFCFLSEVCSI